MREGWKVSTLGRACQIKPPKKEARERLSANDMVSFVPMNDLGVGEKGLKGAVDRTLVSVSGSYTYFADGDVLLAKITPCFENGKLGIARGLTNGVGFGSSEFIVFRPDDSLNAEFLFYFLSQDSFRNEGASVMSGAVGHKRVPKEFVERCPIPLPPLPEQKRIVAILDEALVGIATAVANTEKNLANARELFESYLSLVLLDKHWQWKKLGDLCHGFEYGSSAKSKKVGMVPVVRMGNIQGGQISWQDLVYSDNQEEIERYLLKPNDVLFNRTNSPELVGKTGVYKDQRPAIFAGYLIRINRLEDQLDADFLNYFLNSKIAFDYGSTVVTSSVNQANINATKLSGYPIPAPPLSEQKRIVGRLNELKGEIQRIEQIYQHKLASFAELKQSLLQKAFSGELTATPQDELETALA